VNTQGSRAVDQPPMILRNNVRKAIPALVLLSHSGDSLRIRWKIGKKKWNSLDLSRPLNADFTGPSSRISGFPSHPPPRRMESFVQILELATPFLPIPPPPRAAILDFPEEFPFTYLFLPRLFSITPAPLGQVKPRWKKGKATPHARPRSFRTQARSGRPTICNRESRNLRAAFLYHTVQRDPFSDTPRNG